MIQPTNAQQPLQQPGRANAVNIEINNPQAYANGATPNPALTPGYTNSLYNIPQTSVYEQPQINPQDAYYQQFMPVQNPMINQSPVTPANYNQQNIEPFSNPQAMPDSIITQQPAEQTPSQDVNTANNEIQQVPTVEEASQENNQVDTQALIDGLKSTDAKQRAEAINQIAQIAQNSPEVAKQVVSEPMIQALVDLINEDTSTLEGPNEEQVRVAQKIANNEELTPEEEEISNNLSPRDAADENRMYGLYTLALISKLQKNGITEYADAQITNNQQPIEPVKIEELPGYNDIVNVLQKENERPDVKVAAISALTYLADPQDVPTVQQVLENVANSTDDENLKNAATEASNNLSTLTQEPQQAEQAQAQDGQTQEAQTQEQQPQEAQQPQETQGGEQQSQETEANQQEQSQEGQEEKQQAA